jgi:hypothetical protein
LTFARSAVFLLRSLLEYRQGFRRDGFCSCVSFFAENSLKATSAHRRPPLEEHKLVAVAFFKAKSIPISSRNAQRLDSVAVISNWRHRQILPHELF